MRAAFRDAGCLLALLVIFLLSGCGGYGSSLVASANSERSSPSSRGTLSACGGVFWDAPVPHRGLRFGETRIPRCSTLARAASGFGARAIRNGRT